MPLISRSFLGRLSNTLGAALVELVLTGQDSETSTVRHVPPEARLFRAGNGPW